MIKELIKYFLAWRIATIVFSILFLTLLPNNDIDFLKIWSNWDGGHYIGIAENGYLYPQQFAFFPLYPILIKTLAFTGLNVTVSALLISNIIFLAAIIMLYKIGKLYNLNTEISKKTILLLISFPTAFFFISAYTESLLLFFLTSAIYFAKKQNWFIAATFSLLATFTKITGLTVFIFLIVEYISQNKNLILELKSLSIKQIIKKLEPLFYLVTLGLSGLYIYMLYLYLLLGDPTFFITVQKSWGRTQTIASPLNTLITDFNKYIMTNTFSIQSLEVIIVIISLLLIPFVIKRFGKNLGLLTFFTTTFTLFSGKTESSLRYILLAFPIFWLIAQWSEKSSLLFYTYLFTAIMLQSLFLFLFLNGIWVG